MGISLEVVDHDAMFHTCATVPIIVNDIEEKSEQDKEKFNNLIYTAYKGDVLSNLPSCKCGKIQGAHNLGIYCDTCTTTVAPKIEQELQPVVWMRAPNGVEGLINPIFWLMMENRFVKSGFYVVRWICDTDYHPAIKPGGVMEELELAMGSRNLSRGLNSFIRNFDTFMDILFSMRAFRKSQREMDPLWCFIQEKRHCLFPKTLPMPNRALLVIEENSLGTYIDPIITGVVDAIRIMVGIDAPSSPHTVRVKERRAIKAVAQLSEYYENVYRNTLAKKGGICRKHIYGSRLHFTFRAVISSLTATHRYDEIHIPWGIGVTVFALHLTNRLMKIGYTANEATAFLNRYTDRWHPLLDQMFKELIEEAPGGKGIPVIIQRNPSLERGSAQSVFITRVKSTVEIPTVSISILVVRGLNADFDGDAINFMLHLDNEMAEALYPLSPHMSVFDLREPRKVSSNLSMPKPVVSTIANWMHSPHTVRNKRAIPNAMDAIPEY